jgi:predicted RNA-binding Zn ribbon-like protein
VPLFIPFWSRAGDRTDLVSNKSIQHPPSPRPVSSKPAYDGNRPPPLVQLVKFASVETPRYIAAQRLLGGHTTLDFVNTGRGEGGDAPFECLRSYEDLVAWSHHAGLLRDSAARRLLREARARPSDSKWTHRRALDLRSALSEVFQAIAQGRRPRPSSLDAVRDGYREALAHARLSGNNGGYAWTWADGDDLGRMIWPIVHGATDILTRGDLDRVKTCPACRWLFFDASKNRSRRWCTMEHGCGTEEKMRRYVARRAAKRAS